MNVTQLSKRIIEEQESVSARDLNGLGNSGKCVSLSELSLGNVRFRSLRVAIDAAIYLTELFRQSHLINTYQEHFTPEDLIIEMKTGEVCLRQADSSRWDVRYQAPELAKGNVEANAYTDRYLLGILLFELLTGGTHPLEGRKSLAPVMTPELQHQLYIDDPSFILGHENKGNGPVEKIHYGALFIWKMLPEFVQKLFQRCFGSEGVLNPSSRPSEQEWKEALIRCQNNMIACDCGNVIYDSGGINICGECGTNCEPEYLLEVSGCKINGVSGNRIYRCQISEEESEDVSVIAKIGSLSKDSTKLGIQNTSHENWETKTAGESKRTIKPGEIIPLEDGISFCYNGAVISIRKNETRQERI